MRTVHKFPFSADPAQASDGLTIELGQKAPLGLPAQVLHVGIDPAGDGFVPCLWIEHYPDSPHVEERTFRFFGTGHEIPDHASFIGTVVTPRALVWHVYEMHRTVGL